VRGRPVKKPVGSVPTGNQRTKINKKEKGKREKIK
jgi:hypothetical protein